VRTSLSSRIRQIVILLVILHIVGVAGYMIIEGWGFLDALFMTVITLGTVGYSETKPLDTNGKIFTIFFILIGIGTFTYAISTLAAFWVEYQVFERWERRRMDRQIAQLKDHIILCGGGDSSLHIARELLQTRTPFVVLEIDAAREQVLHAFDDRMLYIIGDASDTEILQRAGVTRARGLISCLPDDKDNLFTVIQARDLNPDMRIVTRNRQEDIRPKLVKAGADAIVSSQRIGALRIASEMLRPHVVSVLDVMLRQPGDVRVQEIPVGQGAAGKTIDELQLQRRAGVIPFAMREAGTLNHLYNPSSERVLQNGDVLIACADPDQLEIARRVATSG
jgi:voltage-gated potassium channel